MSKILVTGGAGYIGSATVRALTTAGHSVMVLDNFSAGHRAAVPSSVKVIEGAHGDSRLVSELLNEENFDAVMHFAASIEAGESMVDPARFYRNNVTSGINLVDAIVDFRKTNSTDLPLVFSSTAAVYGMPEEASIPEDATKLPINVYGETKLIIERLLSSYSSAYGLRSITLRYFNACGADPSGDHGEAHEHETHLIPNALLAAIEGRPMNVFGTDYETPDGTCIRDYIHILDLASAHVRAVEALIGGATTNTYNVGIGSGFSVNEVLDVIDEVTGEKLSRNIQPRRAGDPAILVADSTKIRTELGWQPQYTELQEIVSTAWKWHSTHPNRYNS